MITFGLTVLSLAVLETVLSIDNALILALLASELKPADQKKALRYGLMGAIVLRLVAVFFATRLVRYAWVKVLGGTYLLWLAIRYFIKRGSGDAPKKRAHSGFWMTVFWIEFTDLVFAVDSILAAVALTSDYWAIVIGGLLGVVMIRFAAGLLVGVLKRHRWLEPAAYLLVAGVGIKVLYEMVYSFK